MRKAAAMLLAAILLLGMLPAAALAEELVPVDSVYIETYPNSSSGNDLPTVGQNYSDFYVSTKSAGISVTGWSLVDDSGVPCTGTVENRNYTIYVNISSNIINYVFTANTRVYINAVAATIQPSEDGLSATIVRYSIKPNLIDPVIWTNPKDESHEASSLFSFVASASPIYVSYQWYIMSTYGEKFTPEELQAAYPGTSCYVSETSSGGVKLNISNPNDGMNGWLVYCGFKGYSGGEVFTTKAQINIKGAASSAAPEPTIQIVDVTEEPQSSGGQYIDGVYVPDGVTVVETPGITIVETPEPTAEPTAAPSASPQTAAAEESSSAKAPGSKVLKFVLAGVGALIVLVGAVLFAQYIKDEQKRKKRAKMSGRNYRGKH